MRARSPALLKNRSPASTTGVVLHPVIVEHIPTQPPGYNAPLRVRAENVEWLEAKQCPIRHLPPYPALSSVRLVFLQFEPGIHSVERQIPSSLVNGADRIGRTGVGVC